MNSESLLATIAMGLMIFTMFMLEKDKAKLTNELNKCQQQIEANR